MKLSDKTWSKHSRGSQLTKKDIPKIVKIVLVSFDEPDTQSDDEVNIQ